MKILILGGFGFIGSHLAEELVNNQHRVTILSKTDSKRKNIEKIKDKIEIIINDLKDIGEKVKEFDVIFHLAGTTDNYAIVDEDLDRDIDANCRSTLYLLDACRKYNPSVKIIFASSFFVVGKPEKLPVKEDAKTNPLALYPATRLCGEHFCHIYHNVYNLNVIIARFTNVFGPKELPFDKRKAAFNYMIFSAMKNNDLTLYETGDFVRDYIYVSDVVNGLITIMNQGISDETYFIGRGEGIFMKDLFELIIEVVGQGKIVNIPTPIFHRQVGIKDFYCDNSKLKKLGWEPKVEIIEGIRRTVESYKELL